MRPQASPLGDRPPDPRPSRHRTETTTQDSSPKPTINHYQKNPHHSTGAGARWCSHWWGAAKGSEDRRDRPSCPSEGARDARGEPQRALRRGHRWMVLRGCWGRAVNEAASADGCGRRKGLTRRSAALGRSRTRQIGSTTGSALLSSMNSTGGQAPPGRTMRSLSAGSFSP